MSRAALVRILRRRLPSCTGDSERGSIALYLAIFATGMIAMAGLVIDGGAALATREKAADVGERAQPGVATNGQPH